MFGIPFLLGMMYAAKKQTKAPASLPGPTDAEVLASDQRLRRSMAKTGGKSTLVSGGLADSTARLTMPSLVGIA